MDQLVLMGRQSGDLKTHHSRLPSPRSQEEGRSADIKNKREEISQGLLLEPKRIDCVALMASTEACWAQSS
jgi:hypothetical protein